MKLKVASGAKRQKKQPCAKRYKTCNEPKLPVSLIPPGNPRIPICTLRSRVRVGDGYNEDFGVGVGVH